jgi:hypothetical protein
MLRSFLSMQTKKRAKPVKFGKTKEEKVTKEVAEADINSDESKELKKIIEEKTHPKEDEIVEKTEKEEDSVEKEEDKDDELPEQEETTEDEPEEIRLSEELPEKKEERMALETTDPALEVEPEELHEKEKEEEKEESREQHKSSAVGSFTREEVTRSSKKGYFGFFFLVASITFLLGLIVIGAITYFYPSGTKSSVNLSFLTSPSPTPTSEPTATPEPEQVDLTAYSLRVLNGSGITGEAAKVKSALEEKGFEVASVGNAATSDYTKTIISAKEDVKEEYLNELIKTLQGDYSVNSVVEDAPSSQTADVVVTVGSDSAE